MSSDLNILHLEDNLSDAELIQALLEEQGIVCELERVQSRDDFVAALERGGFDVILSDFSLPGFDGHTALALAREMRPEIPFLFVSGSLGEEAAIDALKSGATDYVLKHRLPRLAPAVRRAVVEAEERMALHRAEEAMIQSEFKYRRLFECLGEAALLSDAKSGRIIDTNRQAEILLDRTRAQILGQNLNRLLAPETLEEYQRHLAGVGAAPDRVVFEGDILSHGDRAIPVAISATPITLYGRHLVLGLYRDITERKRAEAEIEQLKKQLAQYPSGSPEP